MAAFAIATIKKNLANEPWGMNLIHSPAEPELEKAVADLYIREGVTKVSAAAFMKLTPNIVRYAYSGLRQNPDGSIARKNHVFAKISRPEVAAAFMAPAPRGMLDSLVAAGELTAEEARLGSGLAVAENYTVESDSGGHTDNQALGALLPTITNLRDEMLARYQYARPLFCGAAGGIGTPQAAAAAFATGRRAPESFSRISLTASQRSAIHGPSYNSPAASRKGLKSISTRVAPENLSTAS